MRFFDKRRAQGQRRVLSRFPNCCSDRPRQRSPHQRGRRSTPPNEALPDTSGGVRDFTGVIEGGPHPPAESPRQLLKTGTPGDYTPAPRIKACLAKRPCATSPLRPERRADWELQCGGGAMSNTPPVKHRAGGIHRSYITPPRRRQPSAGIHQRAGWPSPAQLQPDHNQKSCASAEGSCATQQGAGGGRGIGEAGKRRHLRLVQCVYHAGG